MPSHSPPALSDELKLEFPADHVLLLVMNRPKAMNAMTPQLEADLATALDWYDNEPDLWAAVITGAGRMFCAGADLKAWNERQKSNDSNEVEQLVNSRYGFGALSRRNNVTAPHACKPIIAAVNGGALAGGLELVLGCDLVVAGEDAGFGMPEVKRGVVVAQGGIPRLAHVAGHQLAAELVLLGRTVSAVDARDRFRFVNLVVPPKEVVSAAVKLAVEITENSPEAVQSSRRALWDVADSPGVEDAFKKHVRSPISARVYSGVNIKEGLASFIQRRKPVWKSPAKL